ncbi:MAG: hypothetical protein E4H32_06135, partial [Nitrospirales bacterium]
MSIIADTLKRLQTQSEEPPPNPKTDMGPRPVFNKGEGAGRHRKDSPFGFLMVMVGMTITLGGLAFAAFWIGGHLDFELATNTQARVNDHLTLPNDPDLLENPVFVDQSSETRVAAATEPTQFPQSPTTPTPKEPHQASASLGTDNDPIAPSPPHEVTTPSRFEVETINPSLTKAMVSTATPDQESLSSSIDQSSRDIEESLIPPLSVSQEPSSVISATKLPTLTTKDSAEDMVNADLTEEPLAPNLVAMSLEEEMIQTEEFIKTSRLLTDSVPGASTHEALKARREPRNHDVKTPASLQPTQANRLRHA